MMNRFKELVFKKKEDLKTIEDREKYDFIVNIMKDEGIFFNLDMEVIIGMLDFLGIEDENEALDIYFDLISMNSFRNNVPKERIIIESTNLLK